MILFELSILGSLLVSFFIGLFIFAGKKVTWAETEDMIDRYRIHIFFLIFIGVMKSAISLIEKTTEKYAINFTPMIHEFEGNTVFWIQHGLQVYGMTTFMAVVYIGSFLFIMVFTLLLFAYMNMRMVASKIIHLYLVLFFLSIPFYFLVLVYTPSYPRMFYPNANPVVTGMQPLLYNYGPNVNQFFMNFDTFNNCFPSMHIGYPAAIIILLFINLKGFKLYKAFLLVMLFLIALAIIYLGIHWLTDIIGGFLIAIIGVLITERYAYGFWKRIHHYHKCLNESWNRLIKRNQQG